MSIFKISLKPYILAVFTIAITLVSLTSCGSDNPEQKDSEPVVAEQTVFMYMPYSGLYNAFQTNIKDFETSIVNNGGLHNNKYIIFISKNQETSYLIKVRYKNKTCLHDTLKTYSFNKLDYTTSTGITSILNDVKTYAAAYNYSMIIGCHGMGWLPVDNSTTKKMTALRRRANAKQMTRYFGHSSESEYQTNISTLAKGIKDTGIKLKYLMFDDCYMSNIETAYELREATNYLIASTSEIMEYGMPYAVIGSYLFSNDFQNICSGFYDFYSSYTTPCGTIGVTDCSQVEQMVQIMKEINEKFPEELSYIGNIQKLDGYTPFTIFFDFGDYVDKLCTDKALKAKFTVQLEKLVPFKAHTPTYYSMFLSGNGQNKITTFSGLAISDPTIDPEIKKQKTQTAWYKATHE